MARSKCSGHTIFSFSNSPAPTLFVCDQPTLLHFSSFLISVSFSLLFCHRFLISSLLCIPVRFSFYPCSFSPLFLSFAKPLLTFCCHCPWCLHMQNCIKCLYLRTNYSCALQWTCCLLSCLYYRIILFHRNVDNYGFQPFLGLTLHNLHWLLTLCFPAAPLCCWLSVSPSHNPVPEYWLLLVYPFQSNVPLLKKHSLWNIHFNSSSSTGPNITSDLSTHTYINPLQRRLSS